jgi:hypothetical protein
MGAGVLGCLGASVIPNCYHANEPSQITNRDPFCSAGEIERLRRAVTMKGKIFFYASIESSLFELLKLG